MLPNQLGHEGSTNTIKAAQAAAKRRIDSVAAIRSRLDHYVRGDHSGVTYRGRHLSHHLNIACGDTRCARVPWWKSIQSHLEEHRTDIVTAFRSHFSRHGQSASRGL
jgi:hypothetical protein